MASMMASTLALSWPSEKFGTHSTSVDIREEDNGRLNLVQLVRTWLATSLRAAPRPEASAKPSAKRCQQSLSDQCLEKNLPIPTRTCTVLIPGFRLPKPAF